MFEIRPAVAYPSGYQSTVDQARRELDQNARPAVASHVENMNDYDIILVGFPIWWHTTPMVVNTFLESYDLSGKTILPFCTSGGSGIEESMAGVRASVGNGTVGTGLTAHSLTDPQLACRKRAVGNRGSAPGRESCPGVCAHMQRKKDSRPMEGRRKIS